MLYTLDVPFVRRTGKVIGIIEYSIDDKWLRPKKESWNIQKSIN